MTFEFDAAAPSAVNESCWQLGFTKREEIALRCFVALIGSTLGAPTEDLAKIAVEKADALINALNQEPPALTPVATAATNSAGDFDPFAED